jgi:hypothetical protein
MFESCTFSDKKCDDWPSHDDMLGRPGVDFINILLTAFTSLHPKVQKYSLFALLGSALVKAAHKILMKLPTGKTRSSQKL